MSDSAVPYKELLDLLVALSEGSIADKDFAHLDALLATDARARAFYLEFMRTSAMLEQRAQSQADARPESDEDDALALLGLESLDLASDAAPDELPDVMSEVVEQALAMRRQHEVEDVANRQLAAQQAKDDRRRRFELRRQAAAKQQPSPMFIPMPVVWLGFAAILCLVATLVIYFDQPTSAPTSNPPGQTAQTPEIDMPVTVQVALIRSSVDARWAGLAYNHSHYLQGGKTVTLRAGFAEVVFGDGTTVILQGPATFEPTGPNGMRLVAGRMTANVPDATLGFTVSTPRGLITNYGTEFGVIANNDGQIMAQAFTGRIGLTPIGGEEVALFAGDAVVADARSEVRTVQPDALAFVRAEEYVARRDAETSPASRWLAHHYAVQRMNGLLAYYPMDEASQQAGVVRNAAPETGSALDGRLGDPRFQAEAPRWVPGRVEGKRALAFDGSRQLAVIEDHDALDNLATITIAAWVRPDYTATRAGALSILGKRESINGRLAFQLHLLSPYYSGGIYPPRSIQFGTALSGDSNDPDLATNRVSTPRLPESNQWVHVVAMGDRDRTRFYINGQLAGEAGGLLTIDNNAPLLLGGTDVSATTNNATRSVTHFAGLIGEVMIFDRLLTQAEVTQLYAGSP